jgi:Toprim-like
MTNLTGISLPALIERDGVALRGGAEKCGACPKCGGDDRFHVRSYNGRDYFFCRKCHEQRGDAITYLRWLHGMSYGEALRELGLQGQSPTLQARRVMQPKPTTTGVVIPDALDEPPASEWQADKLAFVAECEAWLWAEQGVRALAYLRGRGLSDETIRAYRLGFCDRDDYKRGVWRGVTIPTFYAGALWSVNTRRATGEPKYKKATSSKAQLFNADKLAGDVHSIVICGGEFDAMLAQQHAPEGMAAVTFGSESKRVTWECDYLLRGKRVFIAYDNDKAGDDGATKWAKLGERVRVPHGKDLTEFAQAGGDVSAWLAGLALPASNTAELPVNMSEEHLVIEWLQRANYEVNYGEDGRIVAARPTLPAP